jgi:hypothetical protein
VRPSPALTAGRMLGLAAIAVTTACVAGCSSTASHPVAAGPPAVTAPLDTSAAAPGGTWAAVIMGGSSADNNAFGQLFLRLPGSSTWKLVTPPGVATNGGLVLAGRAGSPASRSLLAGFRPGVDLTFSPLTATTDDGTHWSPGSLLQAGLADAPDALAAAPGSGPLLALAQGGLAEQSGNNGTTWTQLATERSLAASVPGRRCGLTTLTAVSFTPSGTPLVAGTCARAGVSGVFARAGGTWQAAGPALPSRLAGEATEVLRLTSTPAGNAALLVAGTGNTASLLAAWTTGGSQWTVSAPLRLGTGTIRSTGFGPGGAVTVTLAGGRAAAISGAGSAWRSLPALPAGTAALASGPRGSLDALTVTSGVKLTDWRLDAAEGTWAKAQAITVPIQYGSSG